MPEPDMKQQAVEIIERMEVIIHNEMLFKGEYVSRYIERQDLKDQGAVCGGHRVCAIGSLWMAAGILPTEQEDLGEEVWFLQTAFEGFREEEFIRCPALELAYDTLNGVSRERIEDGIDDQLVVINPMVFDSALEELFEHTDIDPIDLLEVTSAAIDRLKAV